jgi:hypothetical protein
MHLPRSFSFAGAACWLLMGLGGPVSIGASYSTSYSTLLSDATGVITNAYGQLSAKVSSNLRLSVLFNLQAKKGYTKGPVTVTTDTKGRLFSLVKGRQTCTVSYKTTGAVKAVRCTSSRRALRSDQDEPDAAPAANVGVENNADTLPFQRNLQTGSCDSCVTVAQAAFTTGLAVACGAVPSLLPTTTYTWAKSAAASVCAMTKSLGKPKDLAYGTCDCPCSANGDCTSRVCSGGFCLPTKIATGKPCVDYEDADCLNGHCAQSVYPTGATVCCASNQYVKSLTMNATYCTLIQPNDEPCDANSMCLSGVCSDGLCLASKLGVSEACPDFENADCLNGKCARESYPSGNPVCCSSNSSVYSTLLNDTFCTATQADTDPCDQNSMCVSGVCSANVCLSGPIATGDFCPDFENADCANGVCARSTYPSGDPMCCVSGATVQSLITNDNYCTLTMQTSQPCDQSEMCVNGDCSGGGSVAGTCSD